VEECGVLKISNPEVGAKKGGYFKGSPPLRETYFVVKPMCPHEVLFA
jgi:hypothetical protein